ncbi:Rpn family recombination-promoting nuclease/putative transposase [Lachnospiraceae bacterium ZAX-1]
MITIDDKGNVKYKDTVFRTLFSDLGRLPSLYRAVSGKRYDPSNRFEINTLTDVVAKRSINDLSFTVDGKLVVLIEHQSTISENMPLRFLFYLAELYRRGLEDKDVLYRKDKVKLPKPEFYVLYNGTDRFPLEKTQWLSESFCDLPSSEKPMIDLEVKIINIDLNSSSVVLSKDKSLYGYSYLVNEIRKQQLLSKNLRECIDKAMDLCVGRGILVDFITKHRPEVVDMFAEEFNIEIAERVWKEEGEERGIKKGIVGAVKSLKKFSVSDEDIVSTLVSDFGVSENEARNYVKEYSGSGVEELNAFTP